MRERERESKNIKKKRKNKRGDREMGVEKGNYGKRVERTRGG
jgi:hypothetical protein